MNSHDPVSAAVTSAPTDAKAQEAEESVTIPLIEEHLVLEKRIVETGKVRLHKTVETFEEQLNEPLAVRTFDIERVVLNKVIDAAPDIRQEGETTIYPLVEERLVLTRQLVLKEEVRVTRRLTERRDQQVVTLHREHMTVERVPVESAGPAGAQATAAQPTASATFAGSEPYRR